MGNRLRDLRLRSGVSPQEMVEIVQKNYPKYDKPLQSKCEHTEQYAVELTYPALKALYMEYDPETWAKYKRQTDGHRLTSRIYGRLPEEVYRRFVAQLHQDGYPTVQAWLTDHILAYINARSDDP